MPNPGNGNLTGRWSVSTETSLYEIDLDDTGRGVLDRDVQMLVKREMDR